MSILFEAWRRARGADSRLAETLGAPPSAVAPRRPSLVPWALCFVLAAIAVGLAVYLWRTHTPPPTVSTETSVPRSPPPLSVAAKPQAQAAAVVQSRVAASPLAAPALRTPGVANAVPAGEMASRTAPQTNVVAIAPQPLAVASPETMPIAAAPDDVRQALPQFTVTVHVWNEDPSARFVMVGGQVYRTGDQIAPDVKLVAITQDGEVVDFRGYRLALPGN
ncbi:MAG: general secretion pathway protein GspB [Gammaproteobacteria bacterium]